MEAAIPQQQNDKPRGNKPQEGLGFFRYAWNFTKNLVKDNKFWARMGGVFSGGNLLTQGIVGGFFLLSAPLAMQIAGFAGCVALAAIGVTAIGMGFPGAWQRLENLCSETFPKFNPLRKLRQTSRARLKRNDQPPVAAAVQKKRKGLIGRMMPQLSEDHKDIFLSGVTLEGAAVAVVGWSALALAPAVAAFPAITVGGALLLTWGTWCVGTCLFDIYNSSKTLFQAFRAHKRSKKNMKSSQPTKARTIAPPAQEAAAKPLPPAATTAFNDNTAPAAKKETAAPANTPEAPAKRVSNGPKPL